MAEKDEKVSSARNHHAHCCCAAHHNDTSRHDSLIHQRFQFSRFNRPRKRTRCNLLSSCFRWNCSLAPWRLVGCIMALESRYEDLFREKKYHAGNHNNMADNAFPRHFHILESLCANPIWVTILNCFTHTFFLT